MQRVDELPEVAVRIIDLVSLLVGAGQEALMEACGPLGVGAGKLIDLCPDPSEFRNEVPFRSVIDELPRPEGSFESLYWSGFPGGVALRPMMR